VSDPQTGEYLGMIHLDDIRPYLFDTVMHEAVILEQLMNPHAPTVAPQDDLIGVLQQMDAQRLFSMPVVEDGRFLGMISKGTLLDQYRKELIMQTTE
jgi:CIC family chloride channel protein